MIAVPVPIILVGKMGSGKTSVAECLERIYSTSSFDYKRVVTYTTRKPRPGETEADYHFITNEEFDRLVDDNVIGEYHQFQKGEELVQYGSSFDDYPLTIVDGKPQIKVVILDPDGLHKAIKAFRPRNLSVIFLKVSDETLRKHLELRGDDPEEVSRRLTEEAESFQNVSQYADLTISCEKTTVDEVANIIDRYVHGNLI